MILNRRKGPGAPSLRLAEPESGTIETSRHSSPADGTGDGTNYRPGTNSRKVNCVKLTSRNFECAARFSNSGVV